jgi:hypothetical protein
MERERCRAGSSISSLGSTVENGGEELGAKMTGGGSRLVGRGIKMEGGWCRAGSSISSLGLTVENGGEELGAKMTGGGSRCVDLVPSIRSSSFSPLGGKLLGCGIEREGCVGLIAVDGDQEGLRLSGQCKGDGGF